MYRRPNSWTTNPEKVHGFLTGRAPLAYCDDCIAEAAGVSSREQVNPIACALALTRDFQRIPGVCASCVRKRVVTGALSA